MTNRDRETELAARRERARVNRRELATIHALHRILLILADLEPLERARVIQAARELFWIEIGYGGERR